MMTMRDGLVIWAVVHAGAESLEAVITALLFVLYFLTSSLCLGLSLSLFCFFFHLYFMIPGPV